MTFEINKNAYFDNENLKFLEPNEVPVIKDNRSFIPLRVVIESNAFNRTVRWFEEERKIIIYSSK